MNTKHIRQYVIMLLAVFLTLLGSICRSEKVYAATPVLKATNVWTSESMKIYYNATDFHEAPQILYLTETDGGLRPFFCVEYGKSAHTDDVLAWITEENYSNLNPNQKMAISYVLGSGVEMNPPSETGLGYNVDYTNAAYQAQIKNYWSTQLMLWYYIDKYADNPGSGNTGGITWAGVEATCNAGWGSLAECNRIWYAVEAINQLPSFAVDKGEEYPSYVLTCNEASGKYEILLENTNTQCSLKDFTFSEITGLHYQISNADGTANDNGSYLKITSDVAVSEGVQITVEAEYYPDIGDLWYLDNQTSYQDGLACYGTKKSSVPVEFAFKVYTQNVADLSISKQDITTQAELPGCTLTVTSEDGSITYDTWVSGTTPHIITGLESGNYVLTEINPADGYTTASSILFSYDKTADQVQSVTMYNSKTRIELLKTDEAGNPLPGAKLEVRRKDGAVVESWTSGRAAHVIEGLAAGDYILREVEAPAGYVVSGDVPFTVTDQPGTVVVKMSDKKTRIELLKTDEAGDPLPGAKLEVRRKDGTVVESWTSGRAAHVIEGLAAGDYILREVEAPAGYVISGDVSFTVTDQPGTVAVQMSDRKIYGNFRLIKTSLQIEGKRLEGAKFSLYLTNNGEDTYLGDFITNENGEITIENLPYGNYYLKEIEANEHYYLNEEICSFSIVNDGETVVEHYVNTAITGVLHVTYEKTPGRGELVAGERSPGTGDNAHLLVVFGLLIVSLIGGNWIIHSRYKRLDEVFTVNTGKEEK